MRLVFLGTGGGRHMMASQVRATGGILLDFDNVKFIVDPGPGSLVYAQALKLKPEKWDGVLLSHLHVDNCADANVLLDGMENSFLIAEQHCILPKQKTKSDWDYYPSISVYHQKKVKSLHPVKHGDKVKIKDIVVEVYKADHNDPTVGYYIKHPKIKIAYPADGNYYRGQEKNYDGCDILILNVLVPKGETPKELKHMSVDEAIEFIKNMEHKPKIVILQHFSFWMLRANIWKQAKIIQDATKVKVLNAEDFMELDINTLKTKILKKTK